MENIQLETILFFAKQVVVNMRTSILTHKSVYDIGQKMFEQIMEYLEENSEVSPEELKILTKYKLAFNYSSEEILLLDGMLIDIKEGTRNWREVDISLVENLLENELINQQEFIRYLAHNNYYQEVIDFCKNEPELLYLAQKYGSERTRINFNNYETMKVLESRLKPLAKKEKREKI